MALSSQLFDWRYKMSIYELKLGFLDFLMIFGHSQGFMGVDTRFCTHDLIKENDQNDHPCTQKS